METKLSDQLLTAKLRLTLTTWIKNAWRTWIADQCYMCAHAAVSDPPNDPFRRQSLGHWRQVRNAQELGFLAVRKFSFKEAWNQRPLNNPDMDIHYLLGMVGLTIKFNDDDITTLAMVHAKFDKAIELALEWGI